MLPRELLFFVLLMFLTAIPDSHSYATLKAIPLWFAGGDDPPVLI
jgi:hypothetical protein